jgi:hypothetical protein
MANRNLIFSFAGKANDFEEKDCSRFPAPITTTVFMLSSINFRRVNGIELSY